MIRRPPRSARTDTLFPYTTVVRCRLAVASDFQGLGRGADLRADARRRCAAASEIAGARAVIVHAIDDDAVGFYARHGFIASPLGERVLLMAIEAVRAVQG